MVRLPINGARLATLVEKTRYPFVAYPSECCATVLFCGCSLPSQFPLTTDTLMHVARNHGAGVVFDCCGRPLVEWGRARSSKRVARHLRRRLERLGCRRLVVACPNCLEHLRPLAAAWGMTCLSVYEALGTWGVAVATPFQEGLFFPPCPDRARRTLENQLRALVPGSQAVQTMTGVSCCGLSGAVAARGPQAVRACGERVLRQAKGRPIYTACASCAGQFTRLGYDGPVRLGLSVVLGVEEAPDVAHALTNRARRIFERSLGPVPGSRDPWEEAPCSR